MTDYQKVNMTCTFNQKLLALTTVFNLSVFTGGTCLYIDFHHKYHL